MQAMSSSSAPGTFDFPRLPYDLRVAIYKQALLVEHPINLSQRTSERSVLPNTLNFLFTCKTVFSEALPIFFGGNKFETNNSWSRMGTGDTLYNLGNMASAQITDLKITLVSSIFPISSDIVNVQRSVSDIQRCQRLQKLEMSFSAVDNLLFLKTTRSFATSISRLGRDAQRPMFLVKVALDRYPRLATHPTRYQLSRDLKESEYIDAPLPRCGRIGITTEMASEAFDLLEGYSTNGWSFRRVDVRKVKDNGDAAKTENPDSAGSRSGAAKTQLLAWVKD